MSEVKRFEPRLHRIGVGPETPGMYETESGPWVKYDDYELQMSLARQSIQQMDDHVKALVDKVEDQNKTIIILRQELDRLKNKGSGDDGKL